MFGANGGSWQFNNGDGQDSDLEESEKNIIDCLVLAFPQSGTLADIFKQQGVNHVVFFESEEGSVPTDEPTMVAI